ncbi:hypothetical protein SAY87_014075 [Trapa incisa]|uniref:Protein kinase domain-containing protein n=1 Tax=Trapa incisa TaxID=236973 RepID=A0AAN7JK24_9MYRT|nr:hypothetical protein SAY87_014075 [Trapa incisa]
MMGSGFISGRDKAIFYPLMRKKRKGSQVGASAEIPEVAAGTLDLQSNLRHYSRLKKRCKEHSVAVPSNSFKSRIVGIATAPPCGTSSLVSSGRGGLKRKVGCIDMETQMGRKKKIEDDYVQGDTIGQGKFGSVWLCRSKVSSVELACKTLREGEETVHKEVEIMQHLLGHSGIVTTTGSV